MRLARGPMGPGLLRTPAGDLPPRRDKPAAAKGLRRACPLWVWLGYDLVPFYMVTMSCPGSKTAAMHTAVTAEFWYSGTNDFAANPNYRISLLTTTTGTLYG